MTAPTLAAERTALAWRRTAVGTAATAALFTHEAVVAERAAAVTAALAAALVLVIVAAMSYLRNRSLRHGHWGHGARVIAMTTAAIVTVMIVAAVIAVAAPLI
ncbi:DUF202 domain-containing protein [Nocardia sp. BMG51109]|uniref:DUF202 domain-containing protein n=1 Tax=Nocardia sp. BMG51109 TaxID=1056816 RepID=UPI0004655ACE|nr:DUF202 domain-containing protein [Nocardia sp. BMG51109]